jgi:hypothetical protein
VFHLVTGWSGLVLATRRALADLGLVALPHWSQVPGMVGAGGQLGIELLLLDAGLLMTLWIAWRVARDAAPRATRALAGVMPAAAVATALWAVGVWILCQPMAMRGMMVH